jgi:Phosphotransferase enzyme family
MVSRGIKVIPKARRDDARSALRMLFGKRVIRNLQPVKGGVSGALIFRFDIRGRPYVLRIEPERVALQDRQRGFSCMAAAAAASAAPAVHFTDPAAGIAIMDFVESRPLSEHPDGAAGIARDLGLLARRLQGTAPFPVLHNYPEIIGYLLERLSGSGLFESSLLKRHAEGLERIRTVLPWEPSSLVSSHNDPNPRNLLFDGERFWLIDWELAFRNDPLVDLAILITEFAESADLEVVLLEAAFNRKPDRHLRARLTVMGLLTRLFYGCIVLDTMATRLQVAQDASLDAFTPAAFRAAVVEGKLTSGTPETAYAFGKMSLAAFIDGIAAPSFGEALEIVKDGSG